MNKEIEIKIHPDKAFVSRITIWLKKQAKYTETITQTDYYLNNPDNPFFYKSQWRGKECDDYLRIRKTNKINYLCLKKIHRGEKGWPLYCDEHEVVIDSAEKTLNLMKSIGYTDITILEKKREVYVYDIFEIAIDTVKSLGVFIEIELKKEIENHEAGYKLIHNLLRSMGIKKFKQQSQGYVHQLWNPELDLSKEILLELST